jgi:hypothetical protein
MGKKDGRINIKRNFIRSSILLKAIHLCLVLLTLFEIVTLHTSLFAQKPSFVLSLHSTLYSTYKNDMFLKKEIPDFSFGTYLQYQISRNFSYCFGPMLNFERFSEYQYYGKRNSIVDKTIFNYLMTHLEIAAMIRYKYFDWFYICGGLYTNKYLFSINIETKNIGTKSLKGNIKHSDFLDDPEFGGLIGLEYGFGKWEFGFLFYLPFDRKSNENYKNIDQLKIQLNYNL